MNHNKIKNQNGKTNNHNNNLNNRMNQRIMTTFFNQAQIRTRRINFLMIKSQLYLTYHKMMMLKMINCNNKMTYPITNSKIANMMPSYSNQKIVTNLYFTLICIKVKKNQLSKLIMSVKYLSLHCKLDKIQKNYKKISNKESQIMLIKVWFRKSTKLNKRWLRRNNGK